MRKLIEFLLTRMDTHPEEFLQNRKPDVKHNWVHIIKDNKKFMTDDEYKAIWEKFSEINLERAMQDITERLLAPEPVMPVPIVGEFDDRGILIQQSFGAAQVRAEGQAVAYAMQIEQVKAQMEQKLKASIFDKDF